jgi:excisionase family DNA binding protein
MQKLLSVKEASDLLGCSDGAVRKWIYQRRIKVLKVGRLTRIRAIDVEAIAEVGLAEAGTYPRKAA